MKSAVMIGAGNIGRGFIGQVLHDSGYEVIFVDVQDSVIDALNRYHAYPLTLTDGTAAETKIIDHVCALHARDSDRVAHALAACDIAAVSVGKNALPTVAGTLADAIRERHKTRPAEPLNILICENIRGAAEYVRGLLAPLFAEGEAGLPGNVGLVETTIGRMVPAPPAAMRARNPAAVVAERYCRLPLNAKAFRGAPPKLLYTEEFENFEFFEEKKLFIHNLGHAVCAYAGALRGHTYVWQSVRDPVVRAITAETMTLTANAVADAYRVPRGELLDFVGELLDRFGNRRLNDPVNRVGQDPLRKLSETDRFIGAIGRCKAQGYDYGVILKGIAAALHFQNASDASSVRMRHLIAQQGVAPFVQSHCGLSAEDGRTVERYYGECAPTVPKGGGPL